VPFLLLSLARPACSAVLLHALHLQRWGAQTLECRSAADANDACTVTAAAVTTAASVLKSGNNKSISEKGAADATDACTVAAAVAAAAARQQQIEHRQHDEQQKTHT
jgi:hypothetical protein